MRNSRFASRYGHLKKLRPIEVGRPHLRVKNPIFAGGLEVLILPLYDYYEVALNTAVTAQTLFSIPVGQAYTPAGGAAFNKTKLHTNLVQASVLQSPNKHLVKGLAVFVRGDIVPIDLNLFLGNTLLTFVIGDSKVYAQGLVGRYPGGGGGFSSLTQNNSGIAANGWPDARNLYALGDDRAQQIEQQQTFSVVLDPTLPQAGAFTTQPNTANPVGTGVKAWVHLEGDLARAIQ